MADATTEPRASSSRHHAHLHLPLGGRQGDRVSYKDLRDACRCAGCIDELTGKKTLDKNTIPDDIGIEDPDLVGHYGDRFAWTDGHDTGIYTWERIRALGAE